MVLLVFGLLSCAPPHKTPPIPAVKVGLAWFTQPRETADLLAGFLPDDTPLVDAKVLLHLDELFDEVLQDKTTRTYIGGAAYQHCRSASNPAQQGRGTALARWVAVGRCMEVDFLLVPHIMEFRERDGGDLGVMRPAKVLMDIFLVDIRNAQLTGRSHYEETQEALASNLLSAGKFLSRGGKWVNAGALAREGMEKAVKELGL
jgi:hypothetical protein